MRRIVVTLVLLAVVGCTIQRAIVANEAQHQMVGLSKEQVLACMGPPTGRQAEGATEVWAYPSGGRTDTFSAAQAYGSGTGAYNGMTTGNLSTGTYTGSSSATGFGTSVTNTRYCIVNVVFNSDRVSAVNYQGRTGGLITQGEECAFAVQNCIGSQNFSSPSLTVTPPSSALPIQSDSRRMVMDALYRSCFKEAKLGATPSELDANCRCAAEASEPLVNDDARKTIVSGNYIASDWAFIGGIDAADVAMMRECPRRSGPFFADP